MKKDFQLPEFEVRDAFGALGQSVGWGLTQTNVPKAWTVTKGGGINLYVLDCGQPRHPDLIGPIVAGVNCTKEKDQFDYNGHSTAICSILCAQENDEGLIGICPDSKIVTVKVMDSSGSGDIPSLYAGLKFVLDEALSRGQRTGYSPHLAICSLGSRDPFPAFIEDLIIKIYNAGVIMVCAAGNSGVVEYPAAYEQCIAVGAYDKDQKVTNFSGKGNKLEFICPGQDIYTCWLNSGYKIVRGTSFSGPFLAGIISLALAKHRDQEAITGKNDMKTIQQVRQHLVKHAFDLGDKGKDNSYGYGAINVENLIFDEHSNENLPVLIPFDKPKKKEKPWWKKLLGI